MTKPQNINKTIKNLKIQKNAFLVSGTFCICTLAHTAEVFYHSPETGEQFFINAITFSILNGICALHYWDYKHKIERLEKKANRKVKTL